MGAQWKQKLIIVGLGLAIGLGSIPAQAGTREGAAALQSGDYATAASELSFAARQGDAEAAYLYATMLKDGLGMPAPDLAGAVSWYERAAQAGYSDAQLNLGYMMFHGIGLPQDKDGGVYWYGKAAEAGVAAAQYNLAKVMWDGEVGVKDPAAARKWFAKAAEQGMAEAQFALAVALMTQKRPAMADAVRWLQRAANQGDPRAYTKLAGLYTLGKGVKKDLVQAAKWAVLAEGAGDPMARDLRLQLNNEMTPEQKTQAMHEAQAFRPGKER